MSDSYYEPSIMISIMIRDMQVDYYVAAIYADLVSNEFPFFLKHGNTPWGEKLYFGWRTNSQ